MSQAKEPWTSKRANHASVALAVCLCVAAGMTAAFPGEAQAAHVLATKKQAESTANGSPSQRVGKIPNVLGAKRLGSLSDSTRLRVDVTLLPRDPGALAAYATAVSTPGSEVYHDFLRKGEFAGRFGPTATAIAAVEKQLLAEGLKPEGITSDHLVISLTATAATFAKAFRTGFETYEMESGRVAYANTSAPFLGAATKYVQAVIGMDDLYQLQPHGIERPRGDDKPLVVAKPSQASGPQPCSTAVDDAPSQDAYTANEIASMYNFQDLYSSGDEGSGVTVGLFELEPNLTSDITAYQSCYGTSATVNYIEEDGGAGSGAGTGEAALDIEDVIGLAPDSTIDVYQAPNTYIGVVDNYAAMVDNESVQVISTSWGECEVDTNSSLISAEGTLFEQAATQGQSVFAAAGDHGSTDCGGASLGVDDPGSQPYVTSVGGASTTTDTAPPSQTVWNDSTIEGGAGGGGVSYLQTMPSYQSAAPSSLNVINSNSSGSPCAAASGSYCREVPDVSANADEYTGYLVYFEGSWRGVGGTSAAAPLWAAFIALTDASPACHTAVGFANPVLYDAAAADYSSNFFDVTSGNNDYTPDGYRGGLYPADTGYDMASGLGTPNAANLPAELCLLRNSITVTNPGNQTTVIGAPVSLQMQASDSASGQTLTWSETGLPAGLSIAPSTGLISGTPATQSSSSVNVTAEDTTGASGSATFTWTVGYSNTVTVTNPGVQETGIGTPVSLQMQASDSASGQTLTWSATGLPGGLSIDPSTGLISGTSTPQSSSIVNVTAEDTTGASGSASFTWAVVNPKTKTTLFLSSATITRGDEQVETIRVSVTGAQTTSAAGTVIVKAGSKTLCKITLSFGTGGCQLSPSKLAVGTYSVVATYLGDGSGFNSSTSRAKTLEVKAGRPKSPVLAPVRRVNRLPMVASRLTAP